MPEYVSQLQVFGYVQQAQHSRELLILVQGESHGNFGGESHGSLWGPW